MYTDTLKNSVFEGLRVSFSVEGGFILVMSLPSVNKGSGSFLKKDFSRLLMTFKSCHLCGGKKLHVVSKCLSLKHINPTVYYSFFEES